MNPLEIKINVDPNGKANAELNKLDKKLDDVSRSGGKLSGRIDAGVDDIAKNLMGIAAGALTIQAAFSALGNSLDAFEKKEKALLGVDATIKSMGLQGQVSVEGIDALANSLEAFNKYTVDDTDILDLQTYLLTFDKIGKDALPRASQVVIDLSKKMGTDLKSAAISVGIALDNPAEGFTRLSKAGIKFSKDEQEVIKALVEGGKRAEAQELIFASLEKKVGGFARGTVTALEEQKGKIQDFAEDIQRALGAGIASRLGTLAEAFGNLIPDNVTANYDAVAKSTGELTGRFEQLAYNVETLGVKTNKTAEEERLYKQSLDDLQKEYPNYFQNFDLNKSKFEDITTAINGARIELGKYTEGLIQNAVIQDKMGEIVEAGLRRYEATKKRLELENEYKIKKGTTPSLMDRAAYGMDMEKLKVAIQQQENIVTESLKKENALRAEVMNVGKVMGGGFAPTGGQIILDEVVTTANALSTAITKLAKVEEDYTKRTRPLGTVGTQGLGMGSGYSGKQLDNLKRLTDSSGGKLSGVNVNASDNVFSDLAPDSALMSSALAGMDALSFAIGDGVGGAIDKVTGGANSLFEILLKMTAQNFGTKLFNNIGDELLGLIPGGSVLKWLGITGKVGGSSLTSTLHSSQNAPVINKIYINNDTDWHKVTTGMQTARRYESELSLG